jgi:hypothetical protein
VGAKERLAFRLSDLLVSRLVIQSLKFVLCQFGSRHDLLVIAVKRFGILYLGSRFIELSYLISRLLLI